MRRGQDMGKDAHDLRYATLAYVRRGDQLELWTRVEPVYGRPQWVKVEEVTAEQIAAENERLRS